MKLFAGVRWLFGGGWRRSTRHRHDPADMGTAFGLDATTTLDQPFADTQQREGAHQPTRFELRLNRRSTL